MSRLSAGLNVILFLTVIILLNADLRPTSNHVTGRDDETPTDPQPRSDTPLDAGVQAAIAMTTESTDVSMDTVTEKTPARGKGGAGIDWNKMFSFVPYSIIYCNNITIHLPKEKRVPEQLKVQLDDYEQVVIKQMELSGKRYGGAENFVEMLFIYDKISKQPFVKTVCETGFNAGHSAFVWLLGKSDTKVYSFDIGVHNYTQDMAKYLQKRFPGRLQVTWGNSIETLPEFRKKHPEVKCDLILIDGGHSHDPCQADYDNFRQMANDDNVVILDDYPRKFGGWLKDMGDVWEPAKRRGEISEIFHCVHKNRNHGFAMAHYNRR